MNHEYAWPDLKLVFEGDERVDRDLLQSSWQASHFLDDTLAGLEMRLTDAEYNSKLLLIYYGARIQGASIAGAMLVAQRLGREAIIMARCQYDYFLKMLYYDTHHAEALRVIENIKDGVYEYEFRKKSGLDCTAVWSNTQIANLVSKLNSAREPNFTNDIIGGLKQNPDFQKSANDGNPFARWFFNNIDSTFRVLWKYNSSVLHASPLDLRNVVVKGDGGVTIVNVDSRMKAPNKTIADMTQRCFSAMGLIRWRFGLEFPDEMIKWSERFTEITARHVNEPTDVRSMHD